MKVRRVGHWLINWCWITEIEDFGDGTCRVISNDRTKTPGSFEDGRPIEDSARNVISVMIQGTFDHATEEAEVLRVLNPQHVFSYKKEQPGGES